MMVHTRVGTKDSGPNSRLMYLLRRLNPLLKIHSRTLSILPFRISLSMRMPFSRRLLSSFVPSQIMSVLSVRQRGQGFCERNLMQANKTLETRSVNRVQGIRTSLPFGIICGICEETRKESPEYPIHKLNHDAKFIGM